MKWSDLFDRAAVFEVDEAAVTDALVARRERRAGGPNAGDDAG